MNISLYLRSARFMCIIILSVIIQEKLQGVIFKYVNKDFYSSELINIGDNDVSKALREMNTGLQKSITEGDTKKSQVYLNSILKIIGQIDADSLIISESHYYFGVYYLLAGKNSEAIRWLKSSSAIREMLDNKDQIYAKSIYNLGVAYNNLGDYKKLEYYALKSLETEKKIFGESSPALLTTYLSLVTACLALKEYDIAITYGNLALELIKSRQYYEAEIADLYINIGICHAKLSDYNKASLYFEKAEEIYRKGALKKDERYLNLLNSLAVVYDYLGYKEKSDEYFNKGILIADSFNSVLAWNFINSLAISLANSQMVEAGEKLLFEAVERAKRKYGENSADYFSVLKNYADYLRGCTKDYKKSLILYEQCKEYIDSNQENLFLKEPVLLGYSLSLSANNEPIKALEIIQQLIYKESPIVTAQEITDNPAADSLIADQWTLSLLRTKYQLLMNLYRKLKEDKYLHASAQTSDLIISVLEKVRLNIGEEESRLILGDRYRDNYLLAIHDFDLCYRKTGNRVFLEKAFEFSEKSKVAGLLASTRELKATQFHIPYDIAELERKLQNEISFYNGMIAEEENKAAFDYILISEWTNNVFNATRIRDSLIAVFEKEYPEYYQIKYNTNVAALENIPAITGKRNNYINYVLADSFLYVFIVNIKYQQLLSLPVDSSFFKNIMEFRNLLSEPVPAGNARTDYHNFIKAGSCLYRILFEPIRHYLISNKILISPDNILSYIPFEAIPVINTEQTSNEINYRNLTYLSNDYRISYTYSATFMAESLKKEYPLFNKAVAFAPVYTPLINVDSLLSDRQLKKGSLRDLPYARNEAGYVSEITGGKLYINNDATEKNFKENAGKFDIIHLAMHTVLNDKYPMHSKMIFSPEPYSKEDGLLNTYEVYGIPLKARMVVLSSCNTGIGSLYDGEGIISLARGFIHSGSRSIILSLWEIEDRTGSDIIKRYYYFLKKGNTKSNALKKARNEYLKSTDQLRAHPYFWSTFVIYGDNTPLYYSRYMIMIVSIIVFVVISAFCYYRKSR